MSWVNVGNIKGDTGATGANGGSAYIRLDSTHGVIYLGDQDYSYTIALSSLKGPKGDTGPAGPVNLVSTLDTADTTNAVTNSAIATAIENISNQIGTITAAQNANLTLLGS
jgi:hypothetical protein